GTAQYLDAFAERQPCLNAISGYVLAFRALGRRVYRGGGLGTFLQLTQFLDLLHDSNFLLERSEPRLSGIVYGSFSLALSLDLATGGPVELMHNGFCSLHSPSLLGSGRNLLELPAVGHAVDRRDCRILELAVQCDSQDLAIVTHRLQCRAPDRFL